MICNFKSGKDGINFYKNDIGILPDGSLKILSTGDKILLSKFDINSKNIKELGILGKGASGYVNLGVYKPFDIDIAIKNVNIYEKSKREQIINDLKPYVISYKNQQILNNNLINIYGIFYEKDNLKLVMELMEFGSLRDFLNIIKLNKNFKMEEKYISYILYQILNGIKYLHDNLNQIHRDIKPENILINYNGDIKISDFGISKYLEMDTNYAKTYVGTIHYMSPERLLCKNYDFTSDIWSIGMIAFELLSGLLPFNSNQNVFNCLNLILNLDVDDILKDLNISDEFRSFLKNCLNKDPYNRYFANELLDTDFIKNNLNLQADFKSWLMKIFYDYYNIK